LAERRRRRIFFRAAAFASQWGNPSRASQELAPTASLGGNHGNLDQQTRVGELGLDAGAAGQVLPAGPGVPRLVHGLTQTDIGHPDRGGHDLGLVGTAELQQAIDLLQEKFNMSVPAADLLSADVYKTMTAGCEAINYVGLGYVGEEKCHHLAFTRDNIDWQMWITTGDKPSPRKMVITYKHLPGQPQYTMQLLKIQYDPMVNDSVFACQIPKGADKIEFQPAEISK
jgi:hypothetical protein